MFHKEERKKWNRIRTCTKGTPRGIEERESVVGKSGDT